MPMALGSCRFCSTETASSTHSPSLLSLHRQLASPSPLTIHEIQIQTLGRVGFSSKKCIPRTPKAGCVLSLRHRIGHRIVHLSLHRCPVLYSSCPKTSKTTEKQRRKVGRSVGHLGTTHLRLRKKGRERGVGWFV